MFSKIYWVFLVLTIGIFGLFLWEVRDLKIQTDLLSLLPRAGESEIKEKAFQRVSKLASQKVNILIGASSQAEAYKAARYFSENFKNKVSVEEFIYEIKETDKEEFLAFNRQYRYQLLDPAIRELLEKNQGELVMQKALKVLYSPVSVNLSQFLKEDPFLLSYQRLLNGNFLHSSLLPYKGLLMTEYKDKYYAFLSVTLYSNQVFSPQKLVEVVNNIELVKTNTQEQFKNTEIIMSGIPLHSYYASSRSMKELSLISWISLIGVIALIYITYRSFQPLIFAHLSLLVGMLYAFTITHWFFQGIHVLTLVFGSSLIGVSIDYSCHFFAEYENQKGNNFNTLKRIFPGVTMGLVTTLLGYIGFFFTPFRGLQEIAVFSSVGLTAAFFTVLVFFTKFYRAKISQTNSFLHKFSKNFIQSFKSKVSGRLLFWVLVGMSLVSLGGLFRLKANDDIRLLYSSSKALIKFEGLTQKILGQRKATQFFLVVGDSEEAVLHKELNLTTKLQKLIQQKHLSSYEAVSNYVPPVKQQTQNYLLIKEKLYEPYLKRQGLELGLSAGEITLIETDLKRAANDKLTLQKFFNNSLGHNLKFLWLDKINNKYASIVLLDGLSDTKSFHSLNYPSEGVYFMDKVSDISSILSKYRTTSLYLLFIVYGIIQLLLFWRYGWLKGMSIMLAPVAAGVFTFAVLGYLGQEINLFHILALFLVLGIGIDYAIFYAEDKERMPSTTLAILISCLSTLLSFSLLSFSGFRMINSFGYTVLIGMFFSYILAPVVTLLDDLRRTEE